MNTEPGQQPASDKGAYNSDKEIADDPKTSALHDLACEPAGYETHEQNDQQTFARHVHNITSAIGPSGSITGRSASVCTKLIMPDRTKSAGQIVDQSQSVVNNGRRRHRC
jgi:hypothetical protein